MKRPRSPGLLENVFLPKAEEEEEDEEEERAAPGRRPKRERRQSSVTLCEVCDIHRKNKYMSGSVCESACAPLCVCAPVCGCVYACVYDTGMILLV